MPRPPEWSTEETNLLGTMTDPALAARIGRSPKAVETQRRKLRVPAFKTHRRKWSRREVAMLGVLTDGAIAARLGISRRCVLMERQRRGMAACKERPGPLRRVVTAPRADDTTGGGGV